MAKSTGKSLVIVESPAKARTIGRYLGKDYTVEASVGHVRDLLRSQLSVDVDNDFVPKYRVPNEKRPVVKELKKLAAKAEKVYLATDLDRSYAWSANDTAGRPFADCASGSRYTTGHAQVQRGTRPLLGCL